MTEVDNDAPTAAGWDDLGFDPEALREKYRQERTKRLRPEGVNQYVEVKGDFSKYLDAPYPDLDPHFTRAAVDEEVDVFVGGGGFAGLSMAARLHKAGFESMRIVEKGGDFGGAWYWNRYPGAQCDIESYCYLPLLEDTGYIPKEKYSYRPEIFEHVQRIANTFDLYRYALLQTEITEMRWLEDEHRWLVETDRGDRIRARFEPRFPHVHPHRLRHCFSMQTLEYLVTGYYRQAAKLVRDTERSRSPDLTKLTTSLRRLLEPMKSGLAS